MVMKNKTPFEHLHLIPLDLPKKGFHHFLCAWLYKDDQTAILIDPGPRSTIPALLQALEAMKVRHLNHILLTHIHLDHAGGLGVLLDRYPETKAICHPRAIPHLVKPERLWESSLKVLYETAVLYGEPAPVAEDALDDRTDFRAGDVRVTVFETPGHAPHHLCFRIGDMLFAGEAAGIFYPAEKGLYLRIAAPPGFDLHAYRRSLDMLRTLDASVICYGHWGRSHQIRTLLDLAAAQTELWPTVIEKYSALESPLFEERVLKTLLLEDPGLSRFHDLPADVRERETYFLGNSFRGIRLALNRNGLHPA